MNSLLFLKSFNISSNEGRLFGSSFQHDLINFLYTSGIDLFSFGLIPFTAL